MRRRLTKPELAASLRAAGRTEEQIKEELAPLDVEADSHTPGPWRYQARAGHAWDGDRFVILADNGSRVAVVSRNGVPSGEEEPNARLISAVTDLLAACEADAAFHEHFDTCDCCGKEMGMGRSCCAAGSEMRDTADTLRTAAIHKARGQGVTP